MGSPQPAIVARSGLCLLDVLAAYGTKVAGWYKPPCFVPARCGYLVKSCTHPCACHYRPILSSCFAQIASHSLSVGFRRGSHLQQLASTTPALTCFWCSSISSTGVIVLCTGSISSSWGTGILPCRTLLPARIVCICARVDRPLSRPLDYAPPRLT